MFRSRRTRPRSAAIVIALALITFVLGHQLIFLITYGALFDVVLARTGHNGQWLVAIISVVLLMAALVAAALRELTRLSRTARATGAGLIDVRRADPRHLARDLMSSWPFVFAGGVGLFVIVENLEHLAGGRGVPGLGVLSSAEYHSPLVVLGLVAGVVSFVLALYRWRRETLVMAIARARRHWPRAAALHRWPLVEQRLHALDKALLPPGRAPPSPVTA